MKIASQAQHAMFTKCAADPDYAKSRGISQDVARQALDEHQASGAPKLPERAGSQRTAPAPAAKAPPKLLQSMRE